MPNMAAGLPNAWFDYFDYKVSERNDESARPQHPQKLSGAHISKATRKSLPIL
jgi:hypothetical protein